MEASEEVAGRSVRESFLFEGEVAESLGSVAVTSLPSTPLSTVATSEGLFAVLLSGLVVQSCGGIACCGGVVECCGGEVESCGGVVACCGGVGD